MESEKDAFYVVKKGDIIGIYRSLNDCQAHLESSESNPSISVYKGYALRKDAEDYLRSHGLKNACYTIGAPDVSDNLFGQLAICPFQQPEENALETDCARKGLQHEVAGMTSSSTTPREVPVAIVERCIGLLPSSCPCILEFDGASKGNPGPAGAGVVLRAEFIGMVFRLREGVGTATCNVAEYRALILGLNYALKSGFRYIRAQGDSNLVCMQVQGLWKIKNQNMADLCKVAKELKDQFLSFEIRHVERALNSEADAQANKAVYLKNGEVQVDSERMEK